jgi:hypothetical protein
MPKMSDTIPIVMYSPVALRGQRKASARFTKALEVRA